MDPIIQERSRLGQYPGETQSATTVIIRSDDPSYGPGTSGQVEKVAAMMSLLRDEIRAAPPYGHIGQAVAEDAVQRVHQTKFDRLAGQWREETAMSSSVVEMAMHPAYQQIIGMGRAAVPYILRELSRQADHWFWALKAITGEDPVPERDRGDLARMTQAWLVWGARYGYRF